MSDHQSLADLDRALPFVDRHIGVDPAGVATMLERLGFESLDALMNAAVPQAIRASSLLQLPAPVSEVAAARELRELAAENRPSEAMTRGQAGAIPQR